MPGTADNRASLVVNITESGNDGVGASEFREQLSPSGAEVVKQIDLPRVGCQCLVGLYKYHGQWISYTYTCHSCSGQAVQEPRFACHHQQQGRSMNS